MTVIPAIVALLAFSILLFSVVKFANRDLKSSPKMATPSHQSASIVTPTAGSTQSLSVAGNIAGSYTSSVESQEMAGVVK